MLLKVLKKKKDSSIFFGIFFPALFREHIKRVLPIPTCKSHEMPLRVVIKAILPPRNWMNKKINMKEMTSCPISLSLRPVLLSSLPWALENLYCLMLTEMTKNLYWVYETKVSNFFSLKWIIYSNIKKCLL